MSAVKLELICLLWPNSNPEEDLFVMDAIEDDKTVMSFRNSLKIANPTTLASFSPSDLILWKCSGFNSQDLAESLNTVQFDGSDARVVRLNKVTWRLRQYFEGEDLSREPIHILIQIRGRESPRVEPPTDRLGTLRAEFVKDCRPIAPSSEAQIHHFQRHQADSKCAIPCNRPYHVSPPTPVTLLHPIFGTFVDECETHTPTREDNALVLEMCEVMSNLYSEERQRQSAILQLFSKHGIRMEPSVIRSESTFYITDADILLHDGFRSCISEIKNEAGSADPYAQASLYYFESTRQQSQEYRTSPLPCILVVLFGPYLCFAGAAWNHRPSVQVLSAVIPFHFHRSDTTLKSMAARQLGAFKNAIGRLQEYYTDVIPNLKSSLLTSTSRDELFPHPTCFTSLSGSRENYEFQYTSRLSDEKMIFFGELLDRTRVCIKFVRRYSLAVHQHFAEQRLTPRPLGFEPLSGGWYMVVMDRVDIEYMDLFSALYDPNHEALRLVLPELHHALSNALAGLHGAGLVHGDIRSSNIMVTTNPLKFLLLDFDWAGEVGEVRYPTNVHAGPDLWRPAEVGDGMAIYPDHDIQMLDRIFGAQPPPGLTPDADVGME